MKQSAERRPMILDLPNVRGRYTENAPLGSVGWFRAGGTAEIMYRPADQEDLLNFLQACPEEIPVTTVGVMSNTIVRDGGVKGVVIRLGGSFTDIDVVNGNEIIAGASALDVNVATVAAKEGLAGLEFLCGVPGTIGGALRMNAGAYGSETADVLIDATYTDRSGKLYRQTAEELHMSYRHSGAPDNAIFLEARFRAQKDNPLDIEARMSDIREKRADTQPVKARTGGSTFANPDVADLVKAGLDPATRTWQLVDMAGCRGLRVGGAIMSEKHCNFMINEGEATAFDLESLGEEVRRRVLDKTGILLRWEIRRLGLLPEDRLIKRAH